MKTLRMSASTENRNARKAITALGGNRGRGVRIPQEMQIVSGRRLRRANRSGKAQVGTFMLEDDGTLRHLETDACRRFHADHVTLRMICTYAGAATQWRRVATPNAVARLRTGAVAVFKGRVLLDPPTVLHRSPPIAATGERRLVLVVDPARSP